MLEGEHARLLVERAYTDNATTPIGDEVRDTMRPYLDDGFGNPSSAHAHGRAAREAVERAREQVATLLDGEPDAVVFTGSGSEADNLAIIGVALAHLGERDHIVMSAIEHPAVLAALVRDAHRAHVLTAIRFGHFGGCVSAWATARATQRRSARPFNPPGAIVTKPRIGRPVKSIARACGPRAPRPLPRAQADDQLIAVDPAAHVAGDHERQAAEHSVGDRPARPAARARGRPAARHRPSRYCGNVLGSPNDANTAVSANPEMPATWSPRSVSTISP